MLHAAVMDRTRLQMLLDAELQKRQSAERTIAGLRMRVSDHSTLVDTVREHIHSTMPCGYESCLQFISAQVAGRMHHCGVVYHSDVDTQLRAYGSTVQNDVHSILANLDRSLEDIRRGDARADLQ